MRVGKRVCVRVCVRGCLFCFSAFLLFYKGLWGVGSWLAASSGLVWSGLVWSGELVVEYGWGIATAVKVTTAIK